jgi:hypothetical protein
MKETVVDECTARGSLSRTPPASWGKHFVLPIFMLFERLMPFLFSSYNREWNWNACDREKGHTHLFRDRHATVAKDCHTHYPAMR